MEMFYYARRDTPLSPNNLDVIRNNLEEFSIDKLVKEVGNSPKDWLGDDYHFYIDDNGDYKIDGDIVLQGSVKVDGPDKDLIATVIYHLCDAITDLRNRLPELDWRLSFDDLEVPWDVEDQCYDLDALS